jgi:hypothetical protein
MAELNKLECLYRASLLFVDKAKSLHEQCGQEGHSYKVKMFLIGNCDIQSVTNYAVYFKSNQYE